MIANQSFISIFSILLYLSAGFTLGYLKRSFISDDTCINTPQGLRNASYYVSPFEGDRKMQDVGLLAHNQYACNTIAAFEELTSLHGRTIYLEKRHKNGEANRDRSASIERKVGEARAAESSFRQCVKKMMPELLNSWDEKASKNELKLTSKKHKEANNEINLQVLRETADALEGSN